MLLSFEVSEVRGEAIKIERFIKKQKSRLFLNKLTGSKDDPTYFKELMKNILG
jgi:hypothetical protein